MDKKQLYDKVINYFRQAMPDPKTELNYKNPFELIVAVVLSAQCTDVRVNKITPALFEKYPTPQAMAQATTEEIFEFIKSCSYPNNKSKHLVAMAKMLAEEFNGEVPSDIDQLQKLPGVGRKSANVIASVVYDKPYIAVDTHVFRVAARIGLTENAKTPLDAEKQLTENIAPELRPKAHHWLILHGRYVCTARKPKCDKCGLKDICKYYNENLTS